MYIVKNKDVLILYCYVEDVAITFLFVTKTHVCKKMNYIIEIRSKCQDHIKILLCLPLLFVVIVFST